jgi:hypothetical protein
VGNLPGTGTAYSSHGEANDDDDDLDLPTMEKLLSNVLRENAFAEDLGADNAVDGVGEGAWMREAA